MGEEPKGEKEETLGDLCSSIKKREFYLVALVVMVTEIRPENRIQTKVEGLLLSIHQELRVSYCYKLTQDENNKKARRAKERRSTLESSSTPISCYLLEYYKEYILLRSINVDFQSCHEVDAGYANIYRQLKEELALECRRHNMLYKEKKPILFSSVRLRWTKFPR